MILLLVLLYFSFFNTYNQNIRSSTIEPFFESLPDHIREINSRESVILFWEPIDMASGLK